MKRQIYYLAFFCFLAFCVLGCVPDGAISQHDLPKIQQKYSNRFEQTRIGMNLSEFKQVWPEAVKSAENPEFVIYEFQESTQYYTENDYEFSVHHWKPLTTHEHILDILFYFTNDKLVKYETNNEPKILHRIND
ncbi:MAG: hypothetical protein FWD70_04695 [Desulfuromonadales bacterium]|nr:hypothetical protein [Desulfuromonadales bacterium]